MLRWTTSSVLVLVASVVAACGGSPWSALPGTATPPAAGGAEGSRAADRAPGSATIVPIPEGTPIALLQTKPAGTRTKVLLPESPRAEPGVAYEFELMVHCGADYSVDFDGSFWDLSAQEGVPGHGGIPSYQGRMRLVSPDQARFDFDPYAAALPPEGSAADLASYYFTRHEGPKPDPGPCV